MTSPTVLPSLARISVVTLAAMLDLPLGISAAGSKSAIVYGALFAPLPYPAADRLVSVALPIAGRPPVAAAGGTARDLRRVRAAAR